MTGPRPVIAAMAARTGFPASRSPALDPRPLPPHACSLPCPLQCHLAGQPRHVDIPRRITARQLHATTGGGAIVEEHDRADASLRLHLARAGEVDLQALWDLAVAAVRCLPDVAARIDREALRLAGGDRVRTRVAQVGGDLLGTRVQLHAI